MRRVVVSGLGMIAPTGNSRSVAWDAALRCRSGAAPISQFDASQLPVRIAAEVKGFDPVPVLGAKVARQSSRFIQFAIAAAKEAIEDSGLNVSAESDRCGCVVGVGMGGFRNIEEQAYEFRDHGARRASPTLLPYAIPNMAAGLVSINFGFQGPSLSTATACASGTHAIGEAYLHLACGMADVMLAGGAEAATSPLSVACFAKMGALSTRNDAPELASRPFDRDRDGFVIGEGCGMLVLEEFEHAKRRGARVYAELLGYGASGDAHHITLPPPDGRGIANCMRATLKAVKVATDEVDYINAHGTSTTANDASESAAIETVFNGHARRLAISSTKGVTGHCLGAAGAIEAIYTVLAIHHSTIPPTANYETPDPACRLDYTSNEPRDRHVNVAISNSCGFGGQNACLAFRRMV